MSASPTSLPPTYVAGFHDEASVRAMPYRPLGRDKRLVSALSFGGSSLAGVFRSDVTEDENIRVVVAAIRAGINIIDTAPWYGFGESERILGRALKQVPRDAYYLHTKVCRYLPSVLEQFDFTYDRTIKSVEESLERLQVEYLDCVQVHDPEFAPNLDIVVSEVLPALAFLQKAGKIRRIGITGYPLDALRYLADHCPPEIVLDTALSYCHFNLHTTQLIDSGTLSYLGAKGIGVICGSPLSMGLLTNRGPPAWHPSSPALKARCVAAAKAANERGVDIAHLALHFALFSNTDVPTIMVSTASLARLEHDLSIVRGEIPLTKLEEEVLETLRKDWFSGPEALACASWEGREVAEYWIKVGKIDRTAYTIAHAKFPHLIAQVETQHSHKS